MTASWTRRTISLTFRLGEFKVFSARLSAAVADVHFPLLPREVAIPSDGVAMLSEVDVLLMSSCPTATPLPRLSLTANGIRYVPLQYDHFYIDVSGSFEDYLGKFSSKTRSTLKRKLKKFAEVSGGQIEWREFSQPEDMTEFHRLARQVAIKTYQERVFGGGLPDNERFHEEMKQLSSHDCVRAYILFHATKPVAYLYCPIRNGILCYDFLGYDPDVGNLSPGTILQYLALERLFEKPVGSIFDFGEGAGSHKELFASNCVRCADVYYFRRSMHNILLVSFHAFLTALSNGVVKTTKALGIKSWLKKLIRSKS